MWIEGKCIYFYAIVGNSAFIILSEIIVFMPVLCIFYFVNDNETLN